MTIRVEDDGGWTVVTLAHPPRNELDRELLVALRAALDRLAERTEPPALLLTSEGRHFSTGYTIEAIPRGVFHRDAAVRAAEPFEQVMRGLVDYPAPIVAAVPGDAWGGAVELLACCDLRVAAETARFAVPAVRLGLVYSHTGLRRLVRGFGSALVRELLLTGRPIDAVRALQSGFLNRVVPRTEVIAVGEALVAELAANPPRALRGSRRVLNLLEEAESLTEAAIAEIAELRHAAYEGAEFRAAREAASRRRGRGSRPR